MTRYAKPPYGEKFQDDLKAISTPWRLYFDFSSRENLRTPEPVTLTGSPMNMTADSDGFYTVASGTVSAIGISRNGSVFYDVGVVAGPIPVMRNDVVQIVYTVDPTVTWFGDIKEN